MVTVTQLQDGRLSLKAHYMYKDRIKNIPTASFDYDTKQWIIGLIALPELEARFKGELVYRTPEWVIKKQPMPDMTQMYKIQDQSIQCPQMKVSPYDYQKYGVKYAIDKINKHGFAIIADDVGLGKTMSAICIMEWMRANKGYKKFLLIVKKAVKQQWLDEILRFTDFGGKDFYYAKIYQDKKKRKKIYDEFNNSEYGVIITSHRLFLNDDYSYLNFDMCIFDEVHELRNKSGKTNQAVKQVIQGKPSLFLTGTPIMSNPEDIYGIVSMVNQSYFGDYRSFSKEFLVKAMTNFGYDTIGAKNLDKFRSLVQDIIIRRTEYEVALELPETIDICVNCNMDKVQESILKAISEQQSEYTSIMSAIEAKPHSSRTNKDIETYRMAEAMSKALIASRQAASSDPRLFERSLSKMMREDYGSMVPTSYKMSNKTEQLLEKVEDIISSGNKVIIFTKFKTNADLITEDIIKKFKVPVIKYTGDVNESDRELALNLFRNSTAHQIIVGTEALSTGVNLQVARYVINIDQPDTYALKVQRIGRARRIGSTHDSVIVYDMITKSTMYAHSKDEERLENIEKNRNVTDALVSIDEAQRYALIKQMKEGA